jgi:thioesterase domain-containing protein
MYQARRIASVTPKDAPSYVSELAAVGARRLRERLTRLGLDVDLRHGGEASGRSVFDTLDRRNREAATRYVRGPIPRFDGRLTVILAERTSQAAVSPHLDDRLAVGRHATGGLEVHRVPSSHLAMLEPPDVDVLAAILKDCIARAVSRCARKAQVRERLDLHAGMEAIDLNW